MSLRNRISMMLEVARLKSGFQQYFRVVPALTLELTEVAYRIRHQVYCEELGWEPVREDGLETDPFDVHSRHCLLQNIHTGEYIGCIRIVSPHRELEGGRLPFQLSCQDTLYSGVPDPYLLMRNAIGEVSRLAIIGKYRRRSNERKKPVSIQASDYGDRAQPRFPYIPVGLYCGMLHMARKQGIEKLYLMTEPTLARHFCMLGGKLIQVGGPVEHRGTRIPYEIPVRETIEQLNRFIRPLFDFIADEVDTAYRNPASVASA